MVGDAPWASLRNSRAERSGSVPSRPVSRAEASTAASASATPMAAGPAPSGRPCGSHSALPLGASLRDLVVPPVDPARITADISGCPSAKNPLPSMPTVSAARVKAAGVPGVEPKARSNPATGDYENVPGESSRERQWRLFGVWRQRGGRRQDEFKRRRY